MAGDYQPDDCQPGAFAGALEAQPGEVLALILEAAELIKIAPPEFAARLSRAASCDGKNALFMMIKNTVAAREARELLVLFEPTDFMRRVVATMRDGTFDCAVFDGCDADHVPPREGLCAFDAAAMNEIEGRG